MGKLPNFSYDIIKACGILSDTGHQSKELNVISYNGAPAKYDLRIWIRDRENPDQKIMGKGLTLNEEEIYFLKETLNAMDLDEPIPQDKGFITGGFNPTGFDTTGAFG